MSDYQETDMMGSLDTNFRTLVDKNRGVFTYGLNDEAYTHSRFEEPTYLGFTIEIDENSALFTSARDFLYSNTSHRDIRSRLSLYENFCKKIKMIFNSQESADETTKTEFVKQHYINSVSGLQSLTKKFVKFKEDKLVFELYEDISLFSTYLAYVYNNLIFSYDTGRVLIPENLMYFNLYIKFSEIRNMTSLKNLASNKISDIKLAQAIKKNTTCIIYKLTDCLFNFFEAVPFGDSVAQSGIDTPNPAHSIVTFDMYFKRINLMMNTPLIPESFMIDNSDSGLALKEISYIETEAPINTDNVNIPTVANNPNLIKDNPNTGLNLLSLDNPNTSLNDEYNKVHGFGNGFGNIFKNATNKGSSSFNTIGIEKNKDGKNDENGMDKYHKSIEEINKFNSDDLLDDITDFLSDINSKDATKKQEEQQNIKSSLNDFKDARDRADILERTKKNGKLKKKKKNYKDQKNNSDDNWIKKTESSWNNIRSGNQSITDFYSKGMSDLNEKVSGVFGNSIGDKVNGITNTVSNELLKTLQKYEGLLNQKKNEMLNTFLYQVKQNTKILLDYNVYTDEKDPMLDPLKDLYTNVGNTVMDELMNTLKDSTNTNLFGGTNTGGGL